MEDRHVMDYGQSMYGGWYATLVINGKTKSLHAETLRELKKQITENGVAASLKNVRRWDN